MKRHQSITQAFTLIELMIVMAIAIILSAIGYVNIVSRMQTSRLDQAAQTLASDLTYARSAAMLKGCPTRFIFCNNKLCTDRNVSNQGGYLGSAAGKARFYAILRYSQAVNALSPEGCYNAAAVNAAGDGFDYWDFDRRPVEIPRGTAFSSIYNGDVVDQSDWSSSTGSAAGASVWFNRSGQGQFPISDTANVVGSSATYRVAFQVKFDDCNLASSDDCLGYLISIPIHGGTAAYTKCNFGATRSTNSLGSNDCY